MIRQSALSIVLGAALTAFAAGGGVIVAQSDDEPAGEEQVVEEGAGEEPVLVQATGPAEEFGLGGTYSADPWDLKVQSLFAAESGQAGITEVRIAVSLRNNLDERIAYSDGAFFSDPDYPRLSVTDASGTERPYSLVRLGHDGVGGSAIQHIEPGMTGRWTIGFQLQTLWADELTLSAMDRSGAALATWDLRSGPAESSWDPPSGVATTALGESIDWLTAETAAIEAVPVDYGTLVCGNPDTEHVTQIVALQMRVVNAEGNVSLTWPGLTFPASAATAMWADGTTANVATQTYAGESEVLRPVSNDIFIVPPDPTGFERALLFAPARDSRLGSFDDDPIGFLLRRPDAEPLWLDLTGTSGSLDLNPLLCDDGSFGTRIPYAFAPGNGFAVSPAPLPPDPADQDRAAQELLTQASFSASLYYQAEGVYEGVTSADLEEQWAGVDFTNTLDNLEVGVVAWSVPSPDTLTLTTRSASDDYFCVGIDAGVPAVFANGPILLDIAGSCEGVAADAEVVEGDTGEEGAAGDEGGAGEGEGETP